MAQDLRSRYGLKLAAFIAVSPAVIEGDVSDAEEEVADAEGVDWDES